MMANAAKDPLWQAKVSAEVSSNPGLREIIEDKCTTCHSPLGRTEAIYDGADHYSLTQMQDDPLALDGVSCTSCHQVKDVGLGSVESFSGHYVIENDRLIYGPYQNPLTNPMEMAVNYTPVSGEQVHESGLCATCHTLFTPTLNNDGEIVGELPEQTPFLEWANSDFPNQDKQCQTCHMPDSEAPVVISNRPPGLGPRVPFAKHNFVGGNVFMLRILRDHRTEIGVTASAAQLDSTIVRTMRLLQNDTVELSAIDRGLRADTLDIDITVTNKSGHKFPTGFPSRRAWIHLRLSEVGGITVFDSGNWSGGDGEISDLDLPYEPHHNLISDDRQVQVYQALMQDVDGAVTYTLLRGADYIKDNRIPPAGFTSSGPYFEYTAPAGMAALDPSFNWTDGREGSGSDTCRYRIGGVQAGISYQLEVRLLYQTITPRFVHDLFQYDTPEVRTFQAFYQDADKAPVCVDSLQVILNPLVPVRLLSLTAERIGSHAHLEWKVADAADHAGFYVFREEPGLTMSQISETLIVGGSTLTFDDTSVPDGPVTYWLQELSRSGQSTRIGTVSLESVSQTRYPFLAPPTPNPARGQSLIRFRLSEPGPVSVHVFDIRGRLLATLVDEHRGSGEHTVTWAGTMNDGTRAVTGLYLVRLRSMDGVFSRRLILME